MLAASSVEPTNDSKDVSDIGHKDDQQVDEKEKAHGNADVTSPVERLLGEQQLQQSSTNLNKNEIDLILYIYHWTAGNIS